MGDVVSVLNEAATLAKGAASAWDEVGSWFGLGNSEKYDAQRKVLRTALTTWYDEAQGYLAQLPSVKTGGAEYNILVSTARARGKSMTELASTQQAQDRLGIAEVGQWKAKAADIKMRVTLAVAAATEAKLLRSTPETDRAVQRGLDKGELTTSPKVAATSTSGAAPVVLGLGVLGLLGGFFK